MEEKEGKGGRGEGGGGWVPLNGEEVGGGGQLNSTFYKIVFLLLSHFRILFFFLFHLLFLPFLFLILRGEIVYAK